MYIGNTVQNQGFTPAVDFFSGNASTTTFTLSRPVASTYQMIVVVANVAQNPGSAYTVSGNTITFASAPPTGTNNIWVEYTSLITQVNALSQAPSVIGPMSVGINNATGVGGTTNPIVSMSGASNNYVQAYVNNTTNGSSSSADLVAYPNNGSDSHGWVDMGITSQTYADTTYTVTGPNESYLFGSAPSGSSTTGNLVYATDSTGTQNAHQFYVGGFTQAKSAYKFAIESTGAHGQLVSGTAVASTSGTSIDFTGIPSWVKRITVMFNGVSTSGASNLIARIGSGSIDSTAYSGSAALVGSATANSTTTTGYLLTPSQGAATVTQGIVTLCLINASTNTWISSGVLASSDAGNVAISGATKSLSGTLDRVRITTVNGTDTFDAGSINIMYEG